MCSAVAAHGLRCSSATGILPNRSPGTLALDETRLQKTSNELCHSVKRSSKAHLALSSMANVPCHLWSIPQLSMIFEPAALAASPSDPKLCTVSRLTYKIPDVCVLQPLVPAPSFTIRWKLILARNRKSGPSDSTRLPVASLGRLKREMTS